MTTAAVFSEIAKCYRCGYDLRGIADEAPCPECGLLAIRSRHPSDALHHTRPVWLRALSRGCQLILGSLGISIVATSLCLRYADQAMHLRVGPQFPLLIGYELAAIAVFVGVALLCRSEDYPPADQADLLLRRGLRCIAAAPLLGVFMLLISELGGSPLPWRLTIRRFDHWLGVDLLWHGALLLLVVGGVAFPVTLFRRLRGLAVRARNPHLREHCSIVGWGSSLSLLYALVLFLIDTRVAHARLESHIALWWPALLLGSLAVILFFLWAVYVLIRFNFAFMRAAGALRAHWQRDDRSAPEG